MRPTTSSGRDSTMRTVASWAPFLVAFGLVVVAGLVILLAASQLLAKERTPIANPTTTPMASPSPSVRLTPAEGEAGSTITVTTEPSDLTPTLAPHCTDRAAFVTDVTVPDNTRMDPGQSFVKTWRLRNSGTCTWTADYSLVFVRGDQMNGAAPIALPHSVAPGATLDLSVALAAPTVSGSYRGDWQLRNADGELFGLESSTGPTFWVKIVVASGPTPIPTATPTSVPGSAGWRAEYYDNRDLNGVPLARDDREIDFGWGNGSPIAGMPADNFSARWNRTLTFQAGTYRFYAQSDDGVRVWLDGQLMINEWHDASGTIYSAERTLAAGSHTVRVEYYENLGEARVRFWWERPADFPQWRGDYYANPTLSGSAALTRNDPTLDFDWRRGAPVGLPVDGFSVRWARMLAFDEGLYRFRAAVDDGIRLYVDDRLVINEWRDGAQREVTGDLRLTTGLHAIRVEYYERSGDAIVRVWWEKVPASYPDWKGEYWSNRELNGSPSLVRNDQNIDFGWGTGSAAAGLPADNWSARWSRTATFEPGMYRFSARADDGVRFYLDEQLRINEWHDSSGGEEYTVDLAIYGSRQLVVEYYEHSSRAMIEFSWRRIGPLPTSTPQPTPTRLPTTVPTTTPTRVPPSPTPTQRPTDKPPAPTATPTPTSTAVPPSPTHTPTSAPPSPTPTLVPPSPTPTKIPPSPTVTPVPVPGPAGARLNEIFSVPVAVSSDRQSVMDDEWIEIYNPGPKAFDLSGWWLDDGNQETPPYRIPRRTVLPPRSFLVLFGEVTGLEFNDDGDTVSLIRPDGRVGEHVTFGRLRPNASYSRDEQGIWHSDWPTSPGAPNSPIAITPGVQPDPPGHGLSATPIPR